MIDLIAKKRENKELTEQEIKFIINEYTKNNIPDYQMSAFLMAVIFQSMTDKETSYLTNAMLHSGEIIDLSSIPGIKVDKHSTGGVGDKVSIALSPIVAACGVPVAKMSGRALGFTGGTIDKLEAINNFSVELSDAQFINQVKKIGVAIIGQSSKLVPADKKIYALRDITGTIDSIPLIASSIMSKKLATGSNAILLDIKVGDGAFMKTLAQAEKLAKVMINIGKHLKRDVRAHITNMSEPLGRTVGNAIEVMEAFDAVKGKFYSHDFEEIIYDSASTILLMARKVKDLKTGRALVKNAIENGQANKKLHEWIKAQNGDTKQIDDYKKLWFPKHKIEIKANKKGWMKINSALGIGLVSMKLGAGRAIKTDSLDYQAGIYIHKKTGEEVAKNEVIATLYSSKQIEKNLVNEYLSHVEISIKKISSPKLIYKSFV